VDGDLVHGPLWTVAIDGDGASSELGRVADSRCYTSPW
jgi:hypothetical protein